MKLTSLVFLLPMAVVAGCVSYSTGGEDCSTLADCNPGKECGLLTECVDGKCDGSHAIELPCQHGCQDDADCPQQMHCRLSGENGTCVADGSCADVSECQGLAHDDCLGEFACKDGVCRFECQEITSCTKDDDCTLVWKECCGASGLDDYTSIRADAVGQWQGREECQRVDCAPCYYCPFGRPKVCWGGNCLESFCDEGSHQCSLRRRDPLDCDADSDCTKVKVDCCGCENGGPEGALNKSFADAFAADLEATCAVMDIACEQAYNCTDRQPVCQQGQCTLPGESPCQCPELWDPVCVALPNDALRTYPNECEARCEEFASWIYHGACECMMDCDCGPCECSVCASNGQTYYCGRMEAECNGQAVLYQGSCQPACDDCLLLGRPPIPACDENFCDQEDICFAQCHGLDWWHTGSCLPGEGSMCAGIAAIKCSSGDLFCLITDNYPDAAGTCIKLGSCREDSHCEHQPLDACPGGSQRVCQDHSCTCN